MPSLLTEFRLATSEEVDPAIEACYQATSFSLSVRNWHLARLPRMRVDQVLLILCPACGEWKSRRSMQIDHMIPVVPYCRNALWTFFTHRPDLAPESPKFREKVKVRLGDFYCDRDNLLLLCSPCNGAKGDRYLDDETYELWIKNVEEAQPPQVDEVNQKIRESKTKCAEFRGDEYLTKGPGKIRFSRRFRVDPIGENQQVALKVGIERQVIDSLHRGRPNWPNEHRQVLEQQQGAVRQEQSGLLCFYCLGIYDRAAFQLDHIRPTAGRPTTGNWKRIYNDPQNLIPVCRTCNSRKSSRQNILRAWYDEQIVARLRDRLAGIDPGMADYRKAKKVRDRILRLR